ncbi:hypothetical protein NXV13_22810 [Bacteroides ovatus]|nr:hypothetical protein [Bacteroides ovatus]
MNKRQFTGFMFLLCTCTAFAQQVEVKKDSISSAVFLPPEQKQPLNMDKEGFILPDMNITPNDRKPTIQTDSMTLHISPPEFIDTPTILPDWVLLSILSAATIIGRIFSGSMLTAI